ncbi:hypothetical protein NLI96_g4376 [Meripilus lineatus]|uniref:NAD(P)-binding protein n=1 Tax=Meripilus lineatus TaxID=2056292 RepID=A0AAD5V550_9APHY|nr:hypothetical protein NLI96_g4376 [Physisporinus lineatus]
MTEVQPRVFLITGAASGFGLHLTELILQNGEIVVATDIDTSGLSSLSNQYPTSQLLVRKLDVSKHQEIKDTFAAAKEAFGRINVVYNNAGYGIAAELEAVPEEQARALFDVVYWGSVNVALEAVKFFREVNGPEVGGRVITTGSMLGIITFPLCGYYNSAKHALEGFVETLASELDPEWNIKLTLLEPGIFRTGAVSNVRKIPVPDAYNKPTLPTFVIRGIINDPNTGADPRKAVKQFYKVASLPDPPLRLAIGLDAVGAIKQQLGKIGEGVDQYASWSEDLGFD